MRIQVVILRNVNRGNSSFGQGIKLEKKGIKGLRKKI